MHRYDAACGKVFNTPGALHYHINSCKVWKRRVENTLAKPSHTENQEDASLRIAMNRQRSWVAHRTFDGDLDLETHGHSGYDPLESSESDQAEVLNTLVVPQKPPEAKWPEVQCFTCFTTESPPHPSNHPTPPPVSPSLAKETSTGSTASDVFESEPDIDDLRTTSLQTPTNSFGLFKVYQHYDSKYIDPDWFIEPEDLVNGLETTSLNESGDAQDQLSHIPEPPNLNNVQACQQIPLDLNPSVLCLLEWHWKDNQKSNQSFEELIKIFQSPDFSIEVVWERYMHYLYTDPQLYMDNSVSAHLLVPVSAHLLMPVSAHLLVPVSALPVGAIATTAFGLAIPQNTQNSQQAAKQAAVPSEPHRSKSKRKKAAESEGEEEQDMLQAGRKCKSKSSSKPTATTARERRIVPPALAKKLQPKKLEEEEKEKEEEEEKEKEKEEEEEEEEEDDEEEEEEDADIGLKAWGKRKAVVERKARNDFDYNSSDISEEIMLEGSSAIAGGRLGGKATGIAPNIGDFSPPHADALNLPEPEMKMVIDVEELEPEADPSSQSRWLIAVYKTQDSDFNPDEKHPSFIIILPPGCKNLGTVLGVLAEKDESVKGHSTPCRWS
ncbi:hypothetical protein FA15DRAFT_657802 [Coprinopsis marcescibilis]|uniref:Uncharacterized protein n=1 Tax=Coprinopsis marcescibilis TaxID=230819 RepID=A0A5C3KP87_COPMA|nr:hypothetical protein FA15DRAFT_657802 [Coprinopsis marcescibilis]